MFALLVLVWFAVIMGVYAIIAKRVSNKSTKNTSKIETLKNGLLSLLLLVVRSKDIDNIQLQYDTFDGTSLPMFSGYSTENACFSYIQNEGQGKNVFYTRHMLQKLQAIDKYIDMHLSTDDQINVAFSDFYKVIEAGQASLSPATKTE
jgi:hypothetical protein